MRPFQFVHVLREVHTVNCHKRVKLAGKGTLVVLWLLVLVVVALPAAAYEVIDDARPDRT